MSEMPSRSQMVREELVTVDVLTNMVMLFLEGSGYSRTTKEIVQGVRELAPNVYDHQVTLCMDVMMKDNQIVWDRSTQTWTMP